MVQKLDAKDIQTGIVGLGLMGSSITTCLLLAGHKVIAVAPVGIDLKHAPRRIKTHLTRAYKEGLTKKKPDTFLKNLTITEDYSLLKGSTLVIECTLEDLEIKKSVFHKIEASVSKSALITSNTSAIPISTLQEYVKYPKRFFGLHWAEPSHTTRFLEVICGDKSDIKKGEYLYQLSYLWGKEPILVRKDIRGFITNRLMYAMYREAFWLVENGYATVEDIDKACRNNAGYFMTLVGVFRWMDLTGVQAYHAVMKELNPTLNNSTHIPQLMKQLVAEGGNGVSNGKGFYNYTPEEAELWKKAFSDFTYEIRQLAMKYPEDVVKRKLKKKKS